MVGFMRACSRKARRSALLHTHNFRSSRLIEQLGVTLEGEQGTSQAVLGDGPSAAAFTEDLMSATAHAPAFRDAAAYDATMSLMARDPAGGPRGEARRSQCRERRRRFAMRCARSTTRTARP